MLASAAKPAPSQASRTQFAGTTAAPAPAAPLSEEHKARAVQALTRQLGPIARVVVKRAAEQCGGDRGRFLQLLLEAAPEADAAALQRELGS
jgi:serine/threonine-protein kinase